MRDELWKNLILNWKCSLGLYGMSYCFAVIRFNSDGQMRCIDLSIEAMSVHVVQFSTLSVGALIYFDCFIQI